MNGNEAVVASCEEFA